METLGPFEDHPALAVAVSGGADSMALALLTRDWVRPRRGTMTALIVDHGLRPESAGEALVTAERLGGLDVSVRILSRMQLAHGSALAERARIMRYEALTAACRDVQSLHLLLGHHAGDQAETLAMRVLRSSRADGLAAMAAASEMPSVRLLRPLLRFEPGALRRYLTDRGVSWIEDPSNRDQRALRPRLRQGFAGTSPAILSHAVSLAGRERTRADFATATMLARMATIRPEGFALITGGRLHEAALSSLIRTIGGAPYPPDPDLIADLAARPRPMTLAGVRIARAGRLGGREGASLLIMREEAAVQAPVEARADTVWDNRFRLRADRTPPAGGTIGKLAGDAVRFRGVSDLPASVLRTLPALRFGKVLAAVPHLGYVDTEHNLKMMVIFSSPKPAAGACFRPADALWPEEVTPQLALGASFGCNSSEPGKPSASVGM